MRLPHSRRDKDSERPDGGCCDANRVRPALNAPVGRDQARSGPVVCLVGTLFFRSEIVL
jgi:hypothetical protein